MLLPIAARVQLPLHTTMQIPLVRLRFVLQSVVTVRLLTTQTPASIVLLAMQSRHHRPVCPSVPQDKFLEGQLDHRTEAALCVQLANLTLITLQACVCCIALPVKDPTPVTTVSHVVLLTPVEDSTFKTYLTAAFRSALPGRSQMQLQASALCAQLTCQMPTM